MIHSLDTIDNAEKIKKNWKLCEQVGFLLTRSHMVGNYTYVSILKINLVHLVLRANFDFSVRIINVILLILSGCEGRKC